MREWRWERAEQRGVKERVRKSSVKGEEEGSLDWVKTVVRVEGGACGKGRECRRDGGSVRSGSVGRQREPTTTRTRRKPPKRCQQRQFYSTAIAFIVLLYRVRAQ